MHGAKHIDLVSKVKMFLVNGSFLLMICLVVCPAARALRLFSPDLGPGGWFKRAQVFHGDGCKGLNHPPVVYWTDVPMGTHSLALTLFDPDAADGQGWWHWIVFNIPAYTLHLPQNPNTLPSLDNDFGTPGYGGPCPPTGTPPHHYVFTLFALAQSSLPQYANRNGLIQWLNQHALAKAVLIGHYGR